jgi:hypothetical protein
MKQWGVNIPEKATPGPSPAEPVRAVRHEYAEDRRERGPARVEAEKAAGRELLEYVYYLQILPATLEQQSWTESSGPHS